MVLYNVIPIGSLPFGQEVEEAWTGAEIPGERTVLVP